MPKLIDLIVDTEAPNCYTDGEFANEMKEYLLPTTKETRDRLRLALSSSVFWTDAIINKPTGSADQAVLRAGALMVALAKVGEIVLESLLEFSKEDDSEA